MISILLSRMTILVSGIMYPAYKSFKAVRTKDAKEYMKWMMYWIAFAIFCVVESFADIFISFWFPFYYELKIFLVLWMWIHPTLMKHEEEIDRLLDRAKAESYSQAVNAGRRTLLYAREVVATAAVRSQAHIAEQAIALSTAIVSTESLVADTNNSAPEKRDARPQKRKTSQRSRRSSESTSLDIDSRMDPMLDSHHEDVVHRRNHPSAPETDSDVELVDSHGDQHSRARQPDLYPSLESDLPIDYATRPRRSSRSRRAPS